MGNAFPSTCWKANVGQVEPLKTSASFHLKACCTRLGGAT